MKYRFTKEISDKKDLYKNVTEIDPYLIENNANQIQKIYDFLNTDTPLLLVNGFLGTGKDKIVKHTLSFTNETAIKLYYNCFETTILDDILLSFFDDFRKLTAQNIIQTPKAKSENFTQKITAYFDSIEKPIIIVLDSFEEILKENKQEILDFIFHLATYDKIKIILISRTFNNADFLDKINYEKISVLAFDKSIFEKYLRANDIKQIGPLSDELYKYTRGYYFYVTLSLKIMKLRNLTLVDFLSGFNKSFLTYNDFILREGLSLIDPVSGHLFRFLTIMRHPVSVKLLQTLHLYNEERITFFIDNLVLTAQDEYLYLQDYYKVIAANSITENIAAKLHKGCVELYNTQLPLKPLDRDLLISRQTMRKEIEYHNMFLPKKPEINSHAVSGAQFMEFQRAPQKIAPQAEQAPVTKKETGDKLQKMSFIFDSEEVEHQFLNNVANSIETFISNKIKKDEELKEAVNLPLVEIINLARQEEVNYNYKRAALLYQTALTRENDDDYYTFLPSIYTKIASAYQNLSDWYNSMKYYEQALEFFNSTGDREKVCEMKWHIAEIYYITFKRDKAKDLLNEVLQNNTLSNNLKVKSYLLLANLADNSPKLVFNYYKKAMETLDDTVEKIVKAELYFKFALMLDEQGEIELAVKSYKKCIEVDSNPKINTYLSSAYSNIATIYDEMDNSELARKYSLESLKIDEAVKNYNGIYVSAMKLAELYLSNDEEKALSYYKKAKSCAFELNEPFYIASCDIAMGDFYFNRKDDEMALKSYLSAYNVAKTNFSKDNIEKIQMRINDIKARVGEDTFNKYEKEYINGR